MFATSSVDLSMLSTDFSSLQIDYSTSTRTIAANFDINIVCVERFESQAVRKLALSFVWELVILLNIPVVS